MSSSAKHHREYAKATRNWDLLRDPDAYRVRAGDRILSEAEEMAILVNEDILPLIQASRRSSRQGVLLEIIELKAGGQSEADRHIFSRTLHGYRGYRRGFKTLVRLVEGATATIKRHFPADGDDAPYFWWARSTTNILDLLEVIAAMDTDQSHAYLMRLAEPDSHPAIRICALESMYAEKAMFDSGLILRLINDPATPDPICCELLYVMLTQSSRFSARGYVEAILPFIDHPEQNIVNLAVDALIRKRSGKRRLSRRYEELLSEGKMEHERLAEIACQLGVAEI